MIELSLLSSSNFEKILQEESISKLERSKESLNGTKDPSKHLLDFENFMHKLIMNISDILARSLQDKWPDLIIEMNANNDTIYYRSDSRMYCFSQNKSSTGKYCGKRHDVVLKVTINSIVNLN